MSQVSRASRGVEGPADLLSPEGKGEDERSLESATI